MSTRFHERAIRDRRVSRIMYVADDVARSAIIVPCVCRVFSPPSSPNFLPICGCAYSRLDLIVCRVKSWDFSFLSRLQCARETPRCILSIFKRHGPSARVAQSLYIKRQGACSSLPPSSRSVREAVVSIEHRVYARGSVTESISHRRATFYLRYLLPLILRPPSSILHLLPSTRTRSLSFHPLAVSLSIRFPFSRSSATFYLLRSLLLLFVIPRCSLHPRGTSNGRWLHAVIPKSY